MAVLHASATCESAQTNTALVAPFENKVISLASVYISADSTVRVDLVTSETHSLVWRQYVARMGGQFSEGALAEVPIEGGLDYTTSDTANVYLSVGYAVPGI